MRRVNRHKRFVFLEYPPNLSEALDVVPLFTVRKDTRTPTWWKIMIPPRIRPTCSEMETRLPSMRSFMATPGAELKIGTRYARADILLIKEHGKQKFSLRCQMYGKIGSFVALAGTIAGKNWRD
jgi:hypothetical protein